MIRPRSPLQPRPFRGEPLDEDALLSDALDQEMGGPPPNLQAGLTQIGGSQPAIDLPADTPRWGNSSPGQQGGPYGLPVTGPPNGAVVSTGPNTTNPGGPAGLDRGMGAAAPPAGTAGAGGRRGWAGTGGTGLNLDMPTGAGNYGRLEGFNTDRAFAGGDENSVKDAFARWVTGLGFDPTTASKEQIEAIIRANLDSAAAYGLNILDVNGENILIETAERGPEWVDTVRGAGGGDAAWQWGAAADGAGASTPPGVEMQTGGPGGAAGGDLGVDLGNIDPSDPDAIRRILAEIQRLMDPSRQDDLLGGAIEAKFR